MKSRIMATGLSCVDAVHVATTEAECCCNAMLSTCSEDNAESQAQRIKVVPFQSRPIVRLLVTRSRSSAGLQMMGDWQMRCIGSNLGMEADLIGNHMPLENFCSRVGNAQNIPGLWRVEYLLSNHSSKSITAAT